MALQDAFELYHREQDLSSRDLSHRGTALPSLGHATSGAISASISSVCTYPLFLLITRLQAQRGLRKIASDPHVPRYRSILDVARTVLQQEGGVLGLYVGLASDTFKTLSDSFLFFLAYDIIRRSRKKSSHFSSEHFSAYEGLGIGFVSGAFAKLITSPIANIVTHKQTMSMVSAGRDTEEELSNTTRSIIGRIHNEKGVFGFWSGYSASLILTLNPSLTFLFFESIRYHLRSQPRVSSDSPREIFLLAAISKACASSVTYPFSLAKSRLQACSDKDIRISDSREPEKWRTPGRRVPKINPPSNVFSMILQIARIEGITGLYEGLGAEIVKGFLGHGITMMLKEAVHKLIIQLYYIVLKMLKRDSSH